MISRWVVSGLVVAGLATGCARTEPVTGPAPLPVTAADLAGVSYNLVAKNADESTLLLGQLRFGAINGDQIAGTWDLRAWNGGSAVPGLPASGPFTGELLGGTVVIRLALSDPSSTLGMFAEGFVGERLTGTISLLPSRSFDGRFEAIRAVPSP